MQCGQLVSKNSISTTLPLKLESCVSLPEGSTMMNSGDLRGTGLVATSGETPSARETAKGMSLRMRVAEATLLLRRQVCFHLSAMRRISAPPAAAASSALCSPFKNLATILGTTEVLKISMYSGFAIPGTPRLGVQCSASWSGVYL